MKDETVNDNIVTYRLTDGSYLIAEELDINEENCAIYVMSPFELIREDGKLDLVQWAITDPDFPVELNSTTVISRSITASFLQKIYKDCSLYNKILSSYSDLDDTDSMQDIYDQVDNLDTLDEFWNKLSKDKTSRWDWSAN
jgi:hypothetical protein